MTKDLVGIREFQELLPCPFCGGSAELIMAHDNSWIRHGGCQADLGAFEDAGDAIAAWNRRKPAEPWQATSERITQKYLRRYPTSKAARAWAGSMVHIYTEHGVWRINAQGYTRAGKFDAWVLPFEEAQKQVAHCGPEKEAAFIKVVQPIGSGRALADATKEHPEETT